MKNEELRMKNLSYIIMMVLLMVACSEEDKPLSLPPTISLNPAEDITRTGARISGIISLNAEGSVNHIRFHYGTSSSMDQTVACTPEDLNPTTVLTDLQPGTTYSYCLEAGNEISSVRSETLTFSTLPNEAPTVSPLRMLNQGPLSITLEYDITDNGGEDITETGFYYRKAGESEEQNLRLPDSQELSGLRARIGNLELNTDYEVQAYATNTLGETRSEVYRFRTGEAIVLTSAGMLAEAVSEEEKYRFTTLTIAGPLNGTDLRYLREMMGIDREGNETPGRLHTLDLTDASMVAGGESYDGNHYTENQRVGSGMFAQCIYLQHLILPDDTETVEENAFENCSALVRLRLSSSLTRLLPSAGCTSLTEIEVPSSCPAFCCTDGVLYDHALTTLIWYPEGRQAEQFALPSTIQAIGNYAFRRAPVREISLPESLSDVGQSAFHAARIEHIALPDGVEVIPNACFQQCERLITVSLGSGVAYLSEYCFEGCTALRHLMVKGTDFVPVCQEETFAGADELLQQGTLHVPVGCLSLYRNHRIWSQFKTMVDDVE